ncbi:methyltransferase domain-containing protein [Cecembia sp.]|uniref:methyltransferase domain-containing protein n=1 Tax=Cecembia sp. TaxID=1898110 RepID=UPI0025C50660|nr:methyltransferase domain-containing protein [Cecembia sp.]
MSIFSKRSLKKEWMDDLEAEGEVLVQTLKELKTINKLLGGNKVTTSALKKIVSNHPKKNYIIADIGCGGGDMIRIMANWAKKEGIHCQFIGVDANPNIIQTAKENLKDLHNVVFVCQNVFDEAFLKDKVDIITCTLFTHHFTDRELVSLFQNFMLKSSLGMVINDLHRHPLAYYSIRLLTQLFSKSPMVKNDGPLSVLRSFQRKELSYLIKTTGFHSFEIEWKWAFRWRVIAYS